MSQKKKSQKKKSHFIPLNAASAKLYGGLAWIVLLFFPVLGFIYYADYTHGWPNLSHNMYFYIKISLMISYGASLFYVRKKYKPQ